VISGNGLHITCSMSHRPPAKLPCTHHLEVGRWYQFANARSVRTHYMDDAQLAADTELDITLYLRNELPEDVFKDHGGKLVKASEGLFQWATVASGFINSSGLSDNECVQHLLGHSRGLGGEGLLDNLYEEVLKEYFKSEEAQNLFRSVMGQLFAAAEPLSIHSLIALRRHAPTIDPEDSNRVPKMLRHLSTLLSDVTPSIKHVPSFPSIPHSVTF
jgi:hypothetical protein